MANASILENCSCKACKWPVVSILCNDNCATTEPYSDWDWWVYCSNPVCINHNGEGKFQQDIDWIKYV